MGLLHALKNHFTHAIHQPNYEEWEMCLRLLFKLQNKEEANLLAMKGSMLSPGPLSQTDWQRRCKHSQ